METTRVLLVEDHEIVREGTRQLLERAGVLTVVGEARQLARRALADVRRISQNLRPSILEGLGLVAALQVLVRDLGEALPEAHVTFELVGEEVALPLEVQLTAFRIAQEALTNVRMHARTASRVSVALVFECGVATLVVEDDGPGFAAGESRQLVGAGHLGLAGMAERARLFGGALAVESEPGGGTTVTLHLPVEIAGPAAVQG